MLLVRLGGTRVDVARETDLERDPAVVHVLHQRLVFDETRGVTYSVRAADVHRLSHGCRAVAFAGMAGARQVVLTRVGERRGVQRGRVARFAPG